jgi:transcription elongation factor Elf1
MLIRDTQKWEHKVGPGRPRIEDFPSDVFQCPICINQALSAIGGAGFGSCRVVRTQVRGVTMKCHRCGLHFTMTWHQLAKASRAILVDSALGPGVTLISDDAAQLFEELAEQAGETRGRRKH